MSDAVRLTVAVVVGGGGGVIAETESAMTLCAEAGVEPDFFAVNDQIAHWPRACVAVSLHAPKLEGWLAERAAKGVLAPLAVWSHRPHKDATRHTPEWRSVHGGGPGGSSGLLAVKIARELGYGRILLCGVPMATAAGHFVRGVKWVAADSYWRAWLAHRDAIAPFVRSFSGRTAETFGKPTIEFLQER